MYTVKEFMAEIFIKIEDLKVGDVFSNEYLEYCGVVLSYDINLTEDRVSIGVLRTPGGVTMGSYRYGDRGGFILRLISRMDS